MNRKLLVVGALIVAALVVLLFELHGEHAPAKTEQVAAAAPAGTPAASASPATPSAAPRLPTAAPADDGSDGSAREYTIGGMQVRDHRSGDPQKLDLPPNVHAPDTRRLPSTLVSAVTAQLTDQLKACAAGLPSDPRGARPRLEGQVTVAIKDHQLSITGATMQPRNLADDAAAQLKQCMEQKAVGLTAAAADEQDLDAYTIRVSYAVP